MAAILSDVLAMAPYPIFFGALKTIIMPNFMLLTESEQLKHISALLLPLKVLLNFIPRGSLALPDFPGLCPVSKWPIVRV